MSRTSRFGLGLALQRPRRPSGGFKTRVLRPGGAAVSVARAVTLGSSPRSPSGAPASCRVPSGPVHLLCTSPNRVAADALPHDRSSGASRTQRCCVCRPCALVVRSDDEGHIRNQRDTVRPSAASAIPPGQRRADVRPVRWRGVQFAERMGKRMGNSSHAPPASVTESCVGDQHDLPTHGHDAAISAADQKATAGGPRADGGSGCAGGGQLAPRAAHRPAASVTAGGRSRAIRRTTARTGRPGRSAGGC